MRLHSRVALAVLAPLALLATLTPTAGAVTDPATVRVAFTARGPSFTQPVAVTSARDGSGRLFVVEQTGRVRLFKPGGSTASTYLDISGAVDSSGERGLLGLAFSPTFTTDRYLWVAYTGSSGTLRVTRFRAASSASSSVSTSTATIVIDVPHPNQSNHNAGQLAFGRDGLLYIGTGDGGGAGDPYGNALNLRSLSGKILRLDVRHSCGGRAYCIPSSNPFATSSTARREIWGYGLRNPWRFSFDRSTGVLFLADVGQGAREEVDKVNYGYPYAPDFGWSCYEGNVVYNSARCRNLGHLVKPSLTYGHRDGYQCGGSVIGGYVYRGSKYKTVMGGQYVFGDYCFGAVWLWNGTKLSRRATLEGVAAFGEDDRGEIWAVSVSAGRLYQMSASAG
jgi:glucose/arabinose dehydrogenase